MQPLTHHTPKPLLEVGDTPLIEHHIQSLKDCGITQIVVNTAHLGDKIESYLRDGRQWGVSIEYSREGEPLETGGAITRALPLLGNEPFILVNGDVYTDYPFERLLGQSPEVAHLVLTSTPAYKSTGDFNLHNGRLVNAADAQLTYAGIGVYNPVFFQQFKTGDSFALGPLLREQASHNRITAELYDGLWEDVGTPERLQQINDQLESND